MIFGLLSLKSNYLSNFKLPIEAYLTDYKVDFELTNRTLKLSSERSFHIIMKAKI